MKYTTFARLRALAVGTLIAVPVLTWIGCRQTAPPSTPPAMVQSATGEQQPVATAPASDVASTPAAVPAGDTTAFTEVHQAILRLQKEPLSRGKQKGGSIQWVYKDAGIRAEFRSDKDKGSDYWNRVKIDYNGNKRDDERWDFKKDGSVKRRVAPGDDENFTETYSLAGDRWVAK